jgi:hypothetical protein
MKSIVIKYGSISGALMALLVFVCIPIASRIGFDTASIVLFFGKIGAIVPAYFGIKNFRETIGGGYIDFWKGLNVGILIVVILCIFYALAWVIIYYWVTPDFPDKYFQYYIQQLKTHGALPDVIAKANTDFAESKKVLANPFINAAYAFTDPLETGIILTLIFTAILRKKPPVNPEITEAVVVEEENQNLS